MNEPRATGTGEQSSVTVAPMAKLDPTGKPLWAKQLGDDLDQLPGGIGADPMTGDVILAGSAQGKMNFGTMPLTFTSQGGYDLFVAKFQP